MSKRFEYDVFISYRRKGGSEKAQLLKMMLSQRGFVGNRIFLDTHSIHAENFKDRISRSIKRSAAIIVVVSKDCFISNKEDDYFLDEIKIAISEEKTIIPVFFDDISSFDEILLPSGLEKLRNLNGVVYRHEYVDAVFNRLRDFLIDKNENNKSQLIVLWNILRRNQGVLLIILSLVMLVFVSLLISRVKNTHGFYVYANNGIVLESARLTKKQQEVMTKILNDMVCVEGGSFIMGNTSKGNKFYVAQDRFSENAHSVTVDSFYISKYELTQEQWEAFADINGCAKQMHPDLPIDNVTWEEAQLFVEGLSELTDLKFSLPTEAQWEFAAKGGNHTKNYLYSGSDDVNDVGWVASLDTLIHKTGVLKPNELGLYDMTGNVEEWCADYFEEYAQMHQDNPIGPNVGTLKVVRGGNIDCDVYESKVTVRHAYYPKYKRHSTGLRLVINIK